MMNYIVGIGEILWDMLPEGKQLGGAPANFAFHASQAGMHGIVLSAIGFDSLGAETYDMLVKLDLDNILIDSDLPTSTVNVTIDANGIPHYEITENVAWDELAFVRSFKEIAEEASAACFGTLAQRSKMSHDAIHAFLRAMPDGSLKVFDINLRQNYYSKDIIEESLRIANVLKLNDEEIETLTPMLNLGDDGYEARCRQIIDSYNLKLVVLTCGANGSYVFAADGESSFLPTPKVKVVDTVGAGDSFTATFVASLVKGENIAEAHKKAVDVAAFVCTKHGAMPKHR
jgi:hypothetical protein